MNIKDQDLVKLFSELIRLTEIEKKHKKQKKLKSLRNKRYYQKHKDRILKQNKEMRSIYKTVKQNY